MKSLGALTTSLCTAFTVTLNACRWPHSCGLAADNSEPQHGGALSRPTRHPPEEPWHPVPGTIIVVMTSSNGFAPKPQRDRRNQSQEAKEQRFKVQASERPENQGS